MVEISQLYTLTDREWSDLPEVENISWKQECIRQCLSKSFYGDGGVRSDTHISAAGTGRGDGRGKGFHES